MAYQFCCKDFQKLYGKNDVHLKDNKITLNNQTIEYCPFCGNKIKLNERNQDTNTTEQKIETSPMLDFIEMCQEAIRNAGGVFVARSALEKMPLKEFSEMATHNKIFLYFEKNKEYYSRSKEYKNQNNKNSKEIQWSQNY